MVRSSNEKQDLETVRNVMESSIRLSKIGINIKRVTKTARVIMIENEGSEQLERLKCCDEMKGMGMIVIKPKRQNPRLMVYDVEISENEPDMIEDIYKQNVNSETINLDTFKIEFRCVHKYKT